MINLQRLPEFFPHNRLTLHITFWGVYFLLILTGDLILHEFPFYQAVILKFCFLVPQILLSYYLAYFIIPFFFLEKKYLSFVLFLIVGTYIISSFGRILVVYVAEIFIHTPPFEQESITEIFTDINTLFYHYVISFYSVALIFLFIKYFISYNKIKEESLKLDKEKAEAELKTLRTQLHPHFLFNTLNNIYALALEKSSKTPESIAKLSEILDHILYKCNGNYVALSGEVELLRNYITLEQLRYDDRLIVNFTTDIERDIEIPPLILLSLTENAFKHGAGEDSGSPEINIDICQKEGLFSFNISNTISKDYHSNNPKAIGLSNIEKQLHLLYPGYYKFETENKYNIFTVELEINQKRE